MVVLQLHFHFPLCSMDVIFDYTADYKVVRCICKTTPDASFPSGACLANGGNGSLCSKPSYNGHLPHITLFHFLKRICTVRTLLRIESFIARLNGSNSNKIMNPTMCWKLPWYLLGKQVNYTCAHSHFGNGTLRMHMLPP